jgi:hypothetical protein
VIVRERLAHRRPGARLLLVRAILGLAATLAFAVSAPNGGGAVSQTISASINQNDDLAMTFADGTPIGAPALPGTLIPPGTYQVSVNDGSDISNFDLSGPGVSLATSVQDLVQVTWTVTFQPCSEYSYVNDTVATSTEWFQTSASSSSSAPCASAGAGVAPVATPTTPAVPPPTAVTTNTPGPDQPSASKPASSKAPLFRGTLLGTVSSTGALTLTSRGKEVAALKTGRYTIEVSDKTSKDGFTIQEIHAPATTVTGVSFVGKRSVTLDLSAGQWFFYPSFIGKKSYFIVTT